MAALVVAGASLAAVADASGTVVCRNKRSKKLSLRDTVCKGSELPADLAPIVGAAGSTVLAGSTAATTPTTLDSFTVTVPGPGTLVVSVTGLLRIDADATTSAAVTVAASIGLCDTADSSAGCAGTYGEVYTQDADDADGLDLTPAFALARTVSVAAAGPRVFYVNGEAPAGGALGLWEDGIVGLGPVATATFLPAALVVTNP